MNAEKSVTTAVILTVLFGFLGLLYSSRLALLIIGGLWLVAMIGVGVLVEGAHAEVSSEAASAAEQLGTDIGAGLSFFIGLLIVSAIAWIASITVAVMATQRHNREVVRIRDLADEVRHQETLAAMKRGN